MIITSPINEEMVEAIETRDLCIERNSMSYCNTRSLATYLMLANRNDFNLRKISCLSYLNPRAGSGIEFTCSLSELKCMI